MQRFCLLALCIALGGAAPVHAQYEEADGFVPLFNGKDLSGWKVPEGDNGHWQVVDGVIDYDAGSEALQDKNLWTEKSYGDFILKVDWRLKTDPQAPYNVPVVLQDGSTLKDATGKEITIKRFSPDSGFYLRGTSKAQVNIWGWPVGSGEVYSFRNRQADPEVRASVTPRLRADHPIGEWNQFEIYMIQNRLTVMLNQQLVLENAELKGIPEEGPIALQHHGGQTQDGTYKAASSLIQFRNIWIRELPR
jgi:hypothetical protein